MVETVTIKKMGREPKPIDWDIVNELLEAGCTGTEIAANFHIHPDTLYNRVQKEFGITFTAYSAEYDEKGKSLIKLAQYEKALEKDNSMLIWVGKQRMGQREPDSKSELDLSKLQGAVAEMQKFFDQLRLDQSQSTQASGSTLALVDRKA
jgi:AraC-like DNA-binding protein